MFTRVNQGAYLKQAKFAPGKDDEILAILTFYLTPITYDLAVEIDPHIADRLFRKVGPDQNPCKEFDSARFQITPASSAMRYQLHADLPSSGGLIPHVQFSSLRAFKPFANDPNFALAFDATFPAEDKDVVWQLINRMKKTILLTFEEVQPGLDFPASETAPQCEECSDPPRYKTADGQRYFCAEHVRAAGEGIEVEELTMAERTEIAKTAADASLEQETEEKEDSDDKAKTPAARRSARKKKKK